MSFIRDPDPAEAGDRPEETAPERIRDRDDVREALRQAGSSDSSRGLLTRRDGFFIAIFGLAALLLGAIGLLAENDVGVFEHLDEPLMLHDFSPVF